MLNAAEENVPEQNIAAPVKTVQDAGIVLMKAEPVVYVPDKHKMHKIMYKSITMASLNPLSMPLS
jgi:hypothetical protein